MRAINVAFIFILLLSISLLFYTVVISSNNPIQMENMYLDNYKSVDRNYNKIYRDENIFNQEVKFDYIFMPIDNTHKLVVSLNSDRYTDFIVTAFLTRKHTNQYDADLNSINKQKNSYTFSLPNLVDGSWKIIVKIQSQDIIAYKTINFISPIKL